MRDLSPREEEVIALSIEGLTNDAIAERLGLSVGTVNTYWVRIKLKVGGMGRTDTVVKVIQDRAERALRDANTERKGLSQIVALHEKDIVELNAALALLHLAMDQIKSTVWATDRDLVISLIANGEFPSQHFGVTWEVGATVYDIFASRDPESLAIGAHLKALAGEESALRLEGQFANLFLRVMPLTDEEGHVMGCVSILNSVILNESTKL